MTLVFKSVIGIVHLQEDNAKHKQNIDHKKPLNPPAIPTFQSEFELTVVSRLRIVPDSLPDSQTADADGLMAHEGVPFSDSRRGA